MSKLISDKYTQWAQECEARFQKLKSNEEELNRIFINIYGLQDGDTGSRGQGRDRPPGGFAAGNQVAALLCRGLSVRAVFAG